MPKFGLQIDANYRRPVEGKGDIRKSVLRTLHPPEKRATTRPLFLIGLLAMALAGGGLAGLFR